jgi:hypothetical protein
MKKYVLYPGVGRVTSDRALGYISGRQLAACFRVPYSECLDTDIPAIKKVIDFGKQKNVPQLHLLHLIPNDLGIYKLPNSIHNRIMVVQQVPDSVNKNG